MEKPSAVIEDFGPCIADGALDLIRIPRASSESYHVELDRGQRFRFAVAASDVVDVRVADDAEETDPSFAPYADFAGVDLHNFTFRAPRAGAFVVQVVNGASRPVDVAVFFRTL